MCPVTGRTKLTSWNVEIYYFKRLKFAILANAKNEEKEISWKWVIVEQLD